LTTRTRPTCGAQSAINQGLNMEFKAIFRS
jgi:hypothetical protein